MARRAWEILKAVLWALCHGAEAEAAYREKGRCRCHLREKRQLRNEAWPGGPPWPEE